MPLLELKRLIDRLLARHSAQRPESPDEVYDLIEDINDRYCSDTPPPSRGADVTSEVSLTRSEATDGAVIPIRMTARENCPACTTTGDETRVLDCSVCRGEGRVASKRRTFSARIPAGVRNGQKIRLREFGAPGKHVGAPRDLYVTVHIVG
ncbi:MULTISPECIES: DnaJ C-terminal domain-containing protein [unclassified Streptomyces]|uniref:DnaJ C-terminal domain-containing protein n=1 Tax=Streptomyces TaxID=1883 RepID=UPI001EF104C6|nr:MULTISPECIES: DnaJ C-terminal domain-containing protein [unclassified Streptomyces]